MLEKLSYVGSIINGLAMVGSVIYLALQVRQSNRLARLTAIDAMRDSANHFREALLSGKNLETWVKGMQHYDELSDLERYRWDELALHLWDSWQATYLRAVHLGEPFAVKRVAQGVDFASRGTVFANWWAGRRDRFHPDFVRFVEASVSGKVDPPPLSLTIKQARPG